MPTNSVFCYFKTLLMPSHTGLKINIQGEQLYMAVFYMVSEQHGHVYLVGLYIH